MDSENRATRLEDEIAEIEDRRGTRNLFLIVGGVVGLILLVIVIVGARERARIAEIEARPKTEPVEMGRLVGTTVNQAVFDRGDHLAYLEGVGEAELTSDTRFVRSISYTPDGVPDTVPASVVHWSLASSDSLPYVVEPVTNPLLGVNPADYEPIDFGALRPGDYGTGGPNDWQPLEREGENIRIAGTAVREDDRVYLATDSVRARLQGIEGLTPVDSLEVRWATENQADLTAFGRITSTPRPPTMETLFVMTVNSVHPTGSMPEEEEEAAADTTGPGAPADTAAPAGGS